MERILEVLARDGLQVIPSKEIRSAKCQKLYDKVCGIRKKLEKLNGEENEFLNESMDAVADENCEEIL